MKRFNTTISLLCLLAIAGCKPAPRPLDIGADQCEYCLMTVSDERYGGEIVLSTGKVLPFDSVECLAAYLLENAADVHSLWVVDYAQPGALLPVEEATFLHSDALRSPMGLNLTAVNPEAAAQMDVEGQWMDWEEVMDLVRTRGTHSHPAADPMAGGMPATGQ